MVRKTIDRRLASRVRRVCRRVLTIQMMILDVPALAAPVAIIPPPVLTPPLEIAADQGASGNGLARDQGLVVVGTALMRNYEGANRYNLIPIAGATLRRHGHTLIWNGNSLGLDLVPEYDDQSFKFIVAPFVDLNLDRAVSALDPVVARLAKPKLAVEGGAVLGLVRTGIITSKYDTLTVQIQAAHDLGAVHRSFVVTPSIGYVTPLSKAALVTVLASFDVAGSGYARTYFGINRAAQAASGLPLFQPRGGIKSANLVLGGAVSLRGDLRRGFALGVRLNYERLLGDFAGSPLVAMRGNPDQLSGTLGLGYIF